MLVGVACSVLLLDPLSVGNVLAVAACIAAVGYGLWRAGWLGSRHRIVTVLWLADGRWLLAGAKETFPAELAPGTRLFGTALWLRWRLPRRRWRSMLLTDGDLPPNQLRALAVRLRIEALEQVLSEAGPR